MRRLLGLAALLVLELSSCSCAHKETPPAAASASAAPAATTAPATAPATPPAAASPAASELEQATGGQESADGAANEKPESSDVSLERMAVLPPDAQLPAGRWKPGVNYDPVVPEQPTSVAPGMVEVIEFIWLGCPHCYALEPTMRAWQKSKPAYIQFVLVPVEWDAVHRAHAKLLYTLLALGRDDLVDKAFDTIQQQRNTLIGSDDADTLRIEQAWAAQQGVSAADFANAYNSLLVSTNLQRAEDLMLRYRVQSVPQIVINGKYVTDVAKAGSPANLVQLINDLAASEHRH